MGKSPHTAATPRPGAIDWADARTQRVESTSRATIFAQGDPATNVLYIEDGTVRLSVLSHAGRRRSWPSEKRLARALLLLARYGDPETPRRTLPKVSRETLAEMVGTRGPE